MVVMVVVAPVEGCHCIACSYWMVVTMVVILVDSGGSYLRTVDMILL